MAHPISLCLRFDWIEHEFLHFVYFSFVHCLEALSRVTSNSIDISLLQISNVIHQGLDGLATGEQAANGLVDGGVGDRNAEHGVARGHHAECVVNEQITAHQFVNHQLLHQHEGWVRGKHRFHSKRAILIACSFCTRLNLVHPSSIHWLVQHSFKGGVFVRSVSAHQYRLPWSSICRRRCSSHFVGASLIQRIKTIIATCGRHVSNAEDVEWSVIGGGGGWECESSGGSAVSKHCGLFLRVAEIFLIIKIVKHEFKFKNL